MLRQIALTSLAAVALAACSGNASSDREMDDAMRRDLEAVKAGTIEMAPAGDGQKVVSAIEQTGRTQPRPTAPRPRAPEVSTEVAEAPETEPTPDPTMTAPAASEPAATRPSNTPRVSPPPPGGYKTVGEVIRNAPFPIKPVTRTKPPI